MARLNKARPAVAVLRGDGREGCEGSGQDSNRELDPPGDSGPLRMVS